MKSPIQSPKRMFLLGVLTTMLATTGRAQMVAYLDCEQPGSPLVDQVDGISVTAVGTGQTYGIPSVMAGTYGAITLAHSLGSAMAIGGANTGAWEYSLDGSARFSDLSNDYTLMAWIYVPSSGVPANGGAELPIVGVDGAWIGSGFEFGLLNSSTAPNAIMFTTFGIAEFVAVNTIQAGAWQHIALTKSSTAGIIFYTNGVPALTNSTANALAPNAFVSAQAYGICRALAPSGNFNFNNGLLLDEFRAYGTVLDQAGIIQAAKATEFNPELPKVVQQPQDATLATGQALTLTATASGNPPLTNQWYHTSADGSTTTPLPPGPNGSNATVTVTSGAAITDAGTYYLVVANNLGIATSHVASVSVSPPAAPLIVRDLVPSVATVYLGGTVNLDVQLDPACSWPLTYLWKSNGVVFATTMNTSSYPLANLPYAASNGTYSVTVTNPYGTINSSYCTLAIVPPPQAGTFAAVATQMGPMAYWRLGEPAPGTNAFDCWGGHLANYVNALQHQLPGALLHDDDGCIGLTGSASAVRAQESEPFAFGGTNDFTLAAWLNLGAIPNVGQNEWVFSNRRTTGGNAGYAFGITGVNVVGINTQLYFTEFGGGTSLWLLYQFSTGTWYHLVAVCGGGTVRLYINGVPVIAAAVPTITSSTEPLQLGGNPDPDSPAEDLTGQIDEALVFSRALATNEVQALYAARLGATTPPTVTQDPLSATLWSGGSALFQVAASGSEPLSYQWESNNVPILGATNQALSFAGVTLAMNGTIYSVRVSNPAGVTNSAAATLTTLPAPTGGYPQAVLGDNPVAYWRLDESGGTVAHDYWGGHNGMIYGQMTYGQPGALAGDPNTAARFDGSSTYVEVPYSADLNPASFTIECWANVTGGDGNYRAPLSNRDEGPAAGYILYAAAGNDWEFWDGTGSGGAWVISVGPGIVDGQWAHLVGTFDATRSNQVLYVNGQMVASQSNVWINLNHARPLRIGAGVNEMPPLFFFNGGIDEVAVYNSPLSTTQVRDHYLLGTYGTTTPPSITRQPASATITVGSLATLSVEASGSPPLQYQWQINGANLVGATNATLTIPSAYYTDMGTYTVVVSNHLASVMSSPPATLKVVPVPSFVNLTNGLVLHLPLDGSYLDTSGRRNNGTAVGAPTFISGRLGQGVHLSSSSDSGYNYLTVSDANGDLSFGANDSFSVSLWLRFTAGFNDLPIVGNSAGATYNPGWVVTENANEVEWTLEGTSGKAYANPAGGPLINNGAWHQIVVVFDRAQGMGSTFVDGVKVDSRSIAAIGSLVTGNPLTIGQDATGTYGVVGAFDLDDLGVWRLALSDADAASIYSTAGRLDESFDVYGPVTLNIQLSGSNMDLSWQAGTLLQSTNVSGPYTPVPGAAAPFYRSSAGGGPKFFRVKL
jgi:hypothetical protein